MATIFTHLLFDMHFDPCQWLLILHSTFIAIADQQDDQAQSGAAKRDACRHLHAVAQPPGDASPRCVLSASQGAEQQLDLTQLHTGEGFHQGIPLQTCGKYVGASCHHQALQCLPAATDACIGQPSHLAHG